MNGDKNRPDPFISGQFYKGNIPHFSGSLFVDVSSDQHGKEFQWIPYFGPMGSPIDVPNGIQPGIAFERREQFGSFIYPSGDYPPFVMWEKPGRYLLRVAYFNGLSPVHEKLGPVVKGNPPVADRGIGARVAVENAALVVTLVVTVASPGKVDTNAFEFVRTRNLAPHFLGRGGWAYDRAVVENLEALAQTFPSSRYDQWAHYALWNYLRQGRPMTKKTLKELRENRSPKDFQPDLVAAVSHLEAIVDTAFPFAERAYVEGIQWAHGAQDRPREKGWRQRFLQRYPNSSLKAQLPAEEK